MLVLFYIQVREVRKTKEVMENQRGTSFSLSPLSSMSLHYPTPLLTHIHFKEQSRHLVALTNTDYKAKLELPDISKKCKGRETKWKRFLVF